jgi:hypothetical protein
MIAVAGVPSASTRLESACWALMFSTVSRI